MERKRKKEKTCYINIYICYIYCYETFKTFILNMNIYFDARAHF